MEPNVRAASRHSWSATVEFDDDRGVADVAGVDPDTLGVMLDELDDAVGGLAGGHTVAVAIAALLVVHGAHPGASYRGVTCTDGHLVHAWSTPTPGPIGDLAGRVAPPVDADAVTVAARGWWTVAFATLAAAAAECFAEPDAAAAAVRGGLRNPQRVAGLLPPGPRAVALAALAPHGPLDAPPPGSVAVLPAAVLVRLCPSPDPALARHALAALLDASTADRVERWIAQCRAGCPSS